MMYTKNSKGPRLTPEEPRLTPYHSVLPFVAYLLDSHETSPKFLSKDQCPAICVQAPYVIRGRKIYLYQKR